MADSPRRASWAFEDGPELYGLFNKYYGTLWSNGALDQATKGAPNLTVRLRPHHDAGTQTLTEVTG